MPQLGLSALKNNANAKILMAHPIGGTFIGYRQEDFSIGGHAEYTAPFADEGTSTNASFNAVTSELGIRTINLKSQDQTRYVWTNSTRPQIPVNFTQIRFSMSEPSVSKSLSKLASLTYPVAGALLSPPGGYQAGSTSNTSTTGAGNTWVVSIGKYFRGINLVLISCQISLSQTSVSDGSPLFGTAQCVFEPVEVPTEADFNAYFLT